MAPRLFIAGFDIATSCGVAHGVPGEKPRCFTWDLREAGVGRPNRLAYLWRYCDRYFEENAVDALFYERGLRLAVAYEIGMSDDTMALLRGAIGVVEACAAKHKVPRIEGVDVKDARRQLLGPGRVPKGEGKKLVWNRCRQLRWPATNEDESDACALWSYGVGVMQPSMAHLSTPLFAGCRS